MARFYAEIQGNRGKASRMGSKDSGIWGHIRGWSVGARVTWYVNDEGEDVVGTTSLLFGVTKAKRDDAKRVVQSFAIESADKAEVISALSSLDLWQLGGRDTHTSGVGTYRSAPLATSRQHSWKTLLLSDAAQLVTVFEERSEMVLEKRVSIPSIASSSTSVVTTFTTSFCSSLIVFTSVVAPSEGI